MVRCDSGPRQAVVRQRTKVARPPLVAGGGIRCGIVFDIGGSHGFSQHPERGSAAAEALQPIDDVWDPRVRLLLVGINPGRASARRNRHFAGPGNRFWPALAAAGLVEPGIGPDQQHRLPACGVGITNLVERPSATAAEITRDELRAGGRRLLEKVERWRPQAVVVLGVTAYRAAFDAPSCPRGPIQERPGWWLADNPSGLNAHASVDSLARMLARAGARAGLPRDAEPADGE